MNGSGANVAGCGSCHGRCCREYRVQVNVADVRLLAAGTTLHPRQFLRLHDSGGPDGFHLNPGGNGMELHLLRNPTTGACVFLMELGPELARCGVYEHRPMVCRNFPTTLERGAVAVRTEVKCGPDAWNLATMDLCTYRQDLVRAVADRVAHSRAVKAWNDRIDGGSQTADVNELYDHVLTYAPEPA